MNIEEISKCAPEHATHYEVDGTDIFYYCKDYIGRWCNDDGWENWYPLQSWTYDDLDRILKPLH